MESQQHKFVMIILFLQQCQSNPVRTKTSNVKLFQTDILINPAIFLINNFSIIQLSPLSFFFSPFYCTSQPKFGDILVFDDPKCERRFASHYAIYVDHENIPGRGKNDNIFHMTSKYPFIYSILAFKHFI